MFRGRFVSKPVRSPAYRILLVRYIDSNPIQAGLVNTAWDYPHGSARHYLRPTGPPWLARGWGEARVRSKGGAPTYEPDSYRQFFGPSRTPGQTKLVERRLRATRGGDDRLDDLLRASSDRFVARMQWKALLADGGVVGLPVCDASSVERAIEEARSSCKVWSVRSSRKHADGRVVVRVALLREGRGLISWRLHPTARAAFSGGHSSGVALDDAASGTPCVNP